MYAYTFKNHLNCGVHKPQGLPEGSKESAYFARMGKPENLAQAGSAFGEAVKSARLIGASAQALKKPVVLCLSGGIDSEAVAWAFLCSGVHFRAVIMRFKGGLNDFDIAPILAFCKRQNIKHESFEVEPQAFFESGKYLEYGKTYSCQSPQLALHLYLLDHIEGLPVLCWQAPEILYHLKEKSFGLPGDLHSVFLRYFYQNKRPGIPFFFLYTPELYTAFYRTPILQTLIWFGEQGAKVTNFYEHKCITYIQGGFPVRPRAHPYTGFEKLRDLYDKKDGKSFGTAFDDRFRKPLEKISPLPEKHYQIVPDEARFHKAEMESLKKRFLPLISQKQNIQSLFEKEMERLYQSSNLNIIVDSYGKELDLRQENILSAFNPLHKASKLWISKQIEEKAPSILKGKPARVLILASYYGLMSFLILSRGRLKIKTLKNLEIDPFALDVSKRLNSLWAEKGLLECVLLDGIKADYKQSPADIVINTGCEHFKNYDWLKKIPKGVLCALQANNIPHEKHPCAVYSLKEFKETVLSHGIRQILSENELIGPPYKENSGPLHHYMIVGQK